MKDKLTLINDRILFIICNRKKDVYGITSGLYNSATFASEYLNSIGYNSKLVSVNDSNSIDKVVTEFNPHMVIIEALWVPSVKFKELLNIKRHHERRWIVRVHSKAPFLANEGVATQWIRDYTCINDGKIEIAPNTVELTNQLKSAFPHGKFIYMPNIYHMDKCVEKPIIKCKDWIDVGCFGAIRPMKNTFQQALAAIKFAENRNKTLHFHINSTRTEQGGESVIKNLRALFEFSIHKLVEHPWYTHDEFLKVAVTMDIGTQVSFSESFNIVTADFVSAGIPIVASTDIEWMPGICKTSPTSHNKMVEKMSFLYSCKKIIPKIQKLYLRWYNARAKIVWFNLINKIS